ncbi:hypothetical protein JW979_02535, partial [bacterium]|nr:hypothetical protein [candidate division CSSED10-310 bacterium]
YRIPEYQVSIVGNIVSEPNTLKIGEIILEEGKVRKSNFIPSCLNIQCDAKQITASRTFRDRLKVMLDYSSEFYARLMNNKGPQGIFDPSSVLAASMAKISAHLALFIAESIDRYENDILVSSPRELVIYFKELFRRFDVHINVLGREDAQEVFDMWTSHCEQIFRQNTFFERLRQLLETPFEPGSMHYFIFLIHDLLDVLLKVYKTLLDRPWGTWTDRPEPRKGSVFLWDVKSGREKPTS